MHKRRVDCISRYYVTCLLHGIRATGIPVAHIFGFKISMNYVAHSMEVIETNESMRGHLRRVTQGVVCTHVQEHQYFPEDIQRDSLEIELLDQC